MKISVFAVGRMKAGPEKELADRYFERFAKSGPALGLEFSGVTEIAESRAQTVGRAQARGSRAAAATSLASGAALVLLDERGKNLSSEDFANRIAALRDGGPRGRWSSRSADRTVTTRRCATRPNWCCPSAR